MSKPSPLNWTLRFKKHRTTVLLMLPAQESIASTKEKLLHALQARGIKEINGDTVPEDPSEIELGLPIDRNQLNRGWISLEPVAEENGKPAVKRGPKKESSQSLQAANVRNDQAIAFRFKSGSSSDDDGGDPGWDVVLPTLDDEPE